MGGWADIVMCLQIGFDIWALYVVVIFAFLQKTILRKRNLGKFVKTYEQTLPLKDPETRLEAKRPPKQPLFGKPLGG